MQLRGEMMEDTALRTAVWTIMMLLILEGIAKAHRLSQDPFQPIHATRNLYLGDLLLIPLVAVILGRLAWRAGLW